jgi:DNA-directed RNA polymerase subunit M/transcription elongation factor TFIIS
MSSWKGKRNHYRQLEQGTHAAARKHRRVKAAQLEHAEASFRVQCPKCGNVGMAIVEPTMCGGTAADGPLIFWRCDECRAIFSRLTGKIVGEPAGAVTSGAT